MYTDIENELRTTKNPNPVSGHKFQENLIKGLKACKAPVTVINIPRIRSFPNSRRIIVKKQAFRIDNHMSGKTIGCINLPVFNYITKYINLVKELDKLVTNKKESYIFLTFNSYFPQTLVFNHLKKKKRGYKIYRCDVIGDLHSGFGIKSHIKGIKGRLIDCLEDQQDKSVKDFELFVFLAEAMAEFYHADKERYTIIEAIYSCEDKNADIQVYHDNEYEKNKTVFYAGSICREYGMEHLLKAFSLIDSDEYRLLIAGGGDNPDLINRYCKNDKRITYLGIVTPEEVRRYQEMATVLISPRLPDEGFVKYSFPSKTLECLASGKPYIAHKLPCEPPEYADYIQYAHGSTDQDLKEAIVRVCEKSAADREMIGRKARKFVLEQKNPKAMCSKLVDLINNNVN
jgi:glycosyltransferase involved in cell wall biosynthesis